MIVISSCRDQLHAVQTGNRHRKSAIGGTTVAQLAEVITAPGQNGSICLECQRVKSPWGNYFDTREAGDNHWIGLIDNARVAKLTVFVVAPCPKRSVGLERQGHDSPGRRRRHARGPE